MVGSDGGLGVVEVFAVHRLNTNFYYDNYNTLFIRYATLSNRFEFAVL